MAGKNGEAAMPATVYLLGLCIFAMATSEFMVAGMMPSLAAALGVSLPAVGNLVSAFAASVVLGGPALTWLLRSARRKHSLIGLLLLFLVGQAVGALAGDYQQMLWSRLICGVAQSAFFGVALALAAELVGEQRVARAAALVLNGLMLASVAGLPLAAWVDQNWGWRLSFWLVAGMVALAAAGIAALTPSGARPQALSLGEEGRRLARPSLWAAYLSSGLIIGAVFAAFTYLAPLFTGSAASPPRRCPGCSLATGWRRCSAICAAAGWRTAIPARCCAAACWCCLLPWWRWHRWRNGRRRRRCACCCWAWPACR